MHVADDIDSRGTSMQSNNDDSSLGSIDGNIFETSTEREPLPLFVYFTCTVKQKSTCQHTTVRSIPTCIGELLSSVCLYECLPVCYIK